jgi:FAD:protein FMN transferase
MTVEASLAPSHSDPGVPTDHRREGRALASPLRLTVEAAAEDADVDRAWQAVVDVSAAVDTAMSRFREDSEITRLNRAGAPVANLSRYLVAALTAADRARRMTDGRFDARIVVDLERIGFGGVPQTTGAGRQEAIADSRLIRRDGRRGEVELLAPADLGGIGKGLALRWGARAAARQLAGSGFLLDAGGDLVSGGSHAGEPWSIGIEDPNGQSDPVAVVVLGNEQAIVTSSVRIGRRIGPDGQPVHHLIDPRTGQPGGAGLAAVTVAWPDPAWAEVWSKALFLEGAASIAGVARRKGLAAWWVDDAGELSMTPAARQQTSWVRAEARSG